MTGKCRKCGAELRHLEGYANCVRQWHGEEVIHKYWHADDTQCEITVDRETAYRWLKEDEGVDRYDKPVMSFQDLLWHLDAVFAQIRTLGAPIALPPFSETYVFYLGEDERMDEVLDVLWGPELTEEAKDWILMPFKDVTMVEKLTRNNGREVWVVSRVIEATAPNGEGQPFLVFGYELTNLSDRSEPHASQFWYRGCAPDDEPFRGLVGKRVKYELTRNLFMEIPGLPDEENDLGACEAMVRMIVAISHPANYVVKVSPRLTPREERREKQGRANPAKKPHFIVIDHEVLVNLDPRRRRSTGTHASPVPHHRRGHWRRLADRCVHARQRGHRIPVRPSYVGDRKFEDQKNFYEVLLDFGNPEKITATNL